jgi:hypothetical protein
VTPVGKDLWDITIEEVKFESTTNFEISRSAVQSSRFSGDETECRKNVKKTIRQLVDDRDAITVATPFKITEDDLDV